MVSQETLDIIQNNNLNAPFYIERSIFYIKILMTKYRIVKREYPNGNVDYEVQKKILGLFWWNFENVDGSTTGFYDTLGEAKTAIKMHKEKLKKTVIDVK